MGGDGFTSETAYAALAIGFIATGWWDARSVARLDHFAGAGVGRADLVVSRRATTCRWLSHGVIYLRHVIADDAIIGGWQHQRGVSRATLQLDRDPDHSSVSRTCFLPETSASPAGFGLLLSLSSGYVAMTISTREEACRPLLGDYYHIIASAASLRCQHERLPTVHIITLTPFSWPAIAGTVQPEAEPFTIRRAHATPHTRFSLTTGAEFHTGLAPG